MLPEMTEAMKIKHFHAHLRNEASETFRNIREANKRTVKDGPIGSPATAKQKWQKLTFDPNTKSLTDFLAELNEYAEQANDDFAQQMLNGLLYAKTPPHLKRLLKLAFLKNGTFDQKVTNLETELELSGNKKGWKNPQTHCYSSGKAGQREQS